MLVTSIFSFSHSVFYPLKAKFNCFELHLKGSVEMLSIWTNLQFGHQVKGYPFPQTSLGFFMHAVQVFRKHYGKRRNSLQQAISPFPHSVSYPFRELPANFIKYEFVVCKLF